eukprot:5437-Eustigmatos_ZCMA.PRE.1
MLTSVTYRGVKESREQPGVTQRADALRPVDPHYLQEGKEISRTFEHIPSSVGALEAEEVGVEHLLRDINDPSVSTLANQ